jgi:multiple inositol-polyphosphate phosphatase / 2,3-bisphosphoglycerate 3-phosphatase
VFYFGHAETVVPVLAALGLFKDGFPLLAADFGSHAAKQRKFRVSHISPFAVNVALVLYEKQDFADSGTEPSARVDDSLPQQSDTADHYMLELLFKEKSMEFPFATRILWPYSEVRRKYEEYIDRCDFHKICESAERSTASSSNSQHS